jgi:hypothetical protein
MSEDFSNNCDDGVNVSVKDNNADNVDDSSYYYAEFDRLTNGGRVFDSDRSGDTSIKATGGLSPQEVEERREWIQTLEQIYKDYSRRSSHPTLNTMEDVFNQRIVPPTLTTSNISSRSQVTEPTKGRMYPPPNKIREWRNFSDEVESYTIIRAIEVPDNHSRFFSQRVESAKSRVYRGEMGEHGFLLNVLQTSLNETGNLCQVVEEGNYRSIGNADFIIQETAPVTDGEFANSRITIMGEFKSTQNLLLPPNAGALVEKYKSAYNEVVVQRQERTLHWARICHPIGQLLGYMVDNASRYGALTSATRTYFVKIEGQDEDATVYVSRAYFPGEKCYLRAWAYVHSLGQQQPNGDELGVPDDGKGKWLRTEKDESTPPPKRRSSSETPSARRQQNTKPKSTSGKRKRSTSGKNNPGSSMVKERNSVHGRPLSIPWVNLKDFHIGKESPIGCGRNGAVFRATWKGMDVALKQFDVRTTAGQSAYDTELLAYSRLQDAYGKFVPKPMFLSESPSGGVQFLALQMGREVRAGNSADEKIAHMSFRESLLDKLRNKYGIRHNDPHNNFVILQNKAGKDHLAMIDFEDWEDLWQERI